MIELLGLLDNALLQGLSYGIAALGVALAFRVLRYPDLTADGSFLMGASVLAAALSGGRGWATACVLAVLAGAAAGVVTGVLSTVARVNRLLSGILTTMMAYSLAFHVLGNRSNVGLLDKATLFRLAEPLDGLEPFRSWYVHPGSLLVMAVVAGAALALVYGLLRSDLGLLLRAVGGNPSLVDSLGQPTGRITVLGLAVANAFVALSGALVASQQAFADANMGTGIVITLIAGLVIGEEAARRLGGDPTAALRVQVAAPILGVALYFLLYLLILRASILGWLPVRIQPTDLRLLSALVLAAVIALRARRGRGGEAEVLPI